MSCLFNSLSYFIKELDASDLRKLICEYLKTNPKLIENIEAEKILGWENKNFDYYIRNMSKNSTWGGAIEIRCFCEMFKVDVKVKHKRKIIEFKTKDAKGVVTIIYTGNHYEPEIKN